MRAGAAWLTRRALMRIRRNSCSTRSGEQAANAAADQSAERRAQHAAEEPLRREFRLTLLSCLLSNAELLKFIHDQPHDVLFTPDIPCFAMAQSALGLHHRLVWTHQGGAPVRVGEMAGSLLNA